MFSTRIPRGMYSYPATQEGNKVYILFTFWINNYGFAQLSLEDQKYLESLPNLNVKLLTKTRPTGGVAIVEVGIPKYEYERI